jgi:hypothetical protein
MNTRLPIQVILLVVSGVASVGTSSAAVRPAATPTVDRPSVAPTHGSPFFTNAQGRMPASLSKATSDTVAIFGGPGVVEGKFQDALVGGLPDEQGWTSVDETDEPMHWRISTFNASRLDTTVVDNNAYWCGEPSGVGWVAAPGYGNSWNNSLAFDWLVPDPSQPHEVRLRFVFHHDTEPGYDFFLVEVDSGGVFQTKASYDGYNGSQNWGDPPPTPEFFDRSFQFAGNDYSGVSGDRVSIRLRFTSDGAWSDEDGLWDTPFGAVQVDNITVEVDGAPVSQANFEGGPDDADWIEQRQPFAGDFFRVLVDLIDLDPCRENDSPVATFIDDGTSPRNAPGQTTGGSFAVSSQVAADYANSAVVNYSGGLSQGAVALDNFIVSPSFPWDDPTTMADSGLDDGAFLRMDIYQDLPLANGMFWRWSVRSREAAGDWSGWEDRSFVYYSPTPESWLTKQTDLRDLLVDSPDSIQIRLGVIDLAQVFGFPGQDATPSPYFDNVGFYRYDHGGPTIQARRSQLFQDAFPNHDLTFASGPLSEHAVRLDVPQPPNGFGNSVVGDSMIVDVFTNGVGVSLTGNPRMDWALEANPRYGAVRTLPVGAAVSGTSARGWDIWTGETPGSVAMTSSGAVIPERYFFDLSDGFKRANVPSDADEPAMFFPGDRIRFAIFASDDLGRTTSLPIDTSGLISGANYDPAFTVRALPTMVDAPATAPRLLVWDDAAYQSSPSTLNQLTWRRGQFSEIQQALDELGMVEGVDYDLFASRGLDDAGNNLGASEGQGATAEQLSQYTTLLYNVEDLNVFPTDGTDVYGWGGGGTLFSSTTQVLDDWRMLSGPRTALYFGDTFLERGVGLGNTNINNYIAQSMGVSFLDGDVLDDLGGEINPRVALTVGGQNAGLTSNVEFYVHNGCAALRNFDAIAAGTAAIVTHEFMLEGGVPAATVAAGILKEVDVAGDAKRDFTFPFGFSAIHDLSEPGADARSSRASLLADVFSLAGLPVGGGVVAAPDNSARFEVYRVRPNPFNPSTEIRWIAPQTGELQVTVHDLRGRRVATLHDGAVLAGPGKLVWNGQDIRGVSVASGVYVISVSGFGQTDRQKVVLVE